MSTTDLFDMSEHPFTQGQWALLLRAPLHWQDQLGCVVKVVKIGRAGNKPVVTIQRRDTLQLLDCAAHMICDVPIVEVVK